MEEQRYDVLFFFFLKKKYLQSYKWLDAPTAPKATYGLISLLADNFINGTKGMHPYSFNLLVRRLCRTATQEKNTVKQDFKLNVNPQWSMDGHHCLN